MACALLIRHAQASFGTDHYDRLSALGTRQAILAGEYLRATAGPVARIISGSLQRQLATAEQIAARVVGPAGRRPEIEIDGRLDELDIDSQIEKIAPQLDDSGGELRKWLDGVRGSSFSYQKVIRRVFEVWQADANFEGEGWLSFAGRVLAAWRDVMQRSATGDTAIVVSSAAVIATNAQQVMGLPDARVYPLFEAMKNCSITQMLHTRDRCSVSSFNETTYLSAMGIGGGETNLVSYR
jgi:broad specificity phosphatase PhoE